MCPSPVVSVSIATTRKVARRFVELIRLIPGACYATVGDRAVHPRLGVIVAMPGTLFAYTMTHPWRVQHEPSVSLDGCHELLPRYWFRWLSDNLGSSRENAQQCNTRLGPAKLTAPSPAYGARAAIDGMSRTKLPSSVPVVPRNSRVLMDLTLNPLVAHLAPTCAPILTRR